MDDAGQEPRAGTGPDVVAVLDVGTNSVKLLVAARETPAGGWRTLRDEATVTRLGEGLQETGCISPLALERSGSVMAQLVREAREQGAAAVVAVGTAALRQASDGAEAAAELGRRSSVPVQIISGDEESRLACLGARTGLRLPGGSLVIFDTGGGSSQFTFEDDGRLEDRFSLDIGAVRLTETFGLDRAVSAARLQAALAAIREELTRLDDRPRPDVLLGMGGGLTTLTAMWLRLASYDPAVVHGAILERIDVEDLMTRLAGQPADARRTMPGLDPARAEIILAGVCIVRTIMAKLDHDQLIVSARGLRQGVLAERFGP
jgi:exopolyphosphatase / guanosine-5'-triphosphate,3'-diphosphate pyrophosphatase